METMGGRLRKAREKKGLTLEDAQKALKIHPSILNALEEGNARRFLSPVYARSFLRTYARYLGLDADKMLNEYSAEHEEAPGHVLSIQTKTDFADWLRKWPPFIARAAVVILALIVAFILTKGMIRVTRTGVAKKIHAVKITKKKDKERISPPEKPAVNIPPGQPLTLTVKANGEVWTQIKADGKAIFSNVLSKGSVETWKAKEKLELWAGKAEALELTLNGIPLGPPGKGVKKGVLITRKGIKIP